MKTYLLLLNLYPRRSTGIREGLTESRVMITCGLQNPREQTGYCFFGEKELGFDSPLRKIKNELAKIIATKTVGYNNTGDKMLLSLPVGTFCIGIS